MKFQILLVLASSLAANESFILKRSIKDESVSDYLMERICWWNEVCKEEFQTQFRCKCPSWSFCRSPGRYYNAFCSVAETGYIWNQPAINCRRRGLTESSQLHGRQWLGLTEPSSR